MNMKKIWRKVKFISLLTYVIAVILLIGGLSFITWLALVDGKPMNNSHMVNFLSLSIGLASLPGAFVQLVGMIELNKKKKFKVTTVCPKCRHKVDISLSED
ncbi:hypothetical protein EEL31_09865 [Brevibacillus laterosporus]|nr:hypothetical protein [Brevibacillus laterosporus]TPG68800.1 hypothetical protein EEL31_09865 [Brevibacillus laterosporus]